MLEEQAFELCRRDLKPLDLDELLLAVNDEEVAEGVLVADIARVEPPVDDRARGGLGVVQVPEHDVWPGDADFPNVVRGAHGQRDAFFLQRDGRGRR